MVLAGRFELTEGPGWARLVPARDRLNGAAVLVRVFRMRSPESQQALVADLRRAARLRHPGLARVLEVIEEGDQVILSLEPREGRALAEAVYEEPLALPQILQIGTDLATALDFWHAQSPPVYMGYLEPAGILLTPEDRVLIADFPSPDEVLPEQEPSPYWAPEGGPPTAARDLYSLGALIWLLATGAPPRARPWPPSLPAALRGLLEELLEARPERRPRSMRAALASLEALRGSRPSAGGSLWSLLFTPLGQRPAHRTVPNAVPDDHGEHARQARERFARLDLRAADLQPSVACMLPEAVARSIGGVVVERPSDTEVVLALKDPSFVHAYDYVRMALGPMQIRILAAEPALVEQALEFVYRAEVYAETITWPEWLVRRRFHGLPLKVENPIADTSQWKEQLPSRIIETVDTLLKEALAMGASDIHFETARRWMDVRYRIDGVLRRISTFPSEPGAAIVKRLKVLANMDVAQERVPQGGRISVRVSDLECDLRVSVVPVPAGENAVLRVLKKSGERQTLKDLGFPPDQLDTLLGLLAQPHGMLIVAGPTGSGKTTTLYSALQVVERPDRKVLTVEDPIEFEIAGVTQVQIDTSPRDLEKRVTFPRVLREFLRQDPDVILVGEIRDPETAEVAVQAALTGHLLLSTLHANDAVGVLPRLKEMGIEPFLVGSALLATLSQRLARRICDDCREEAEVPAALREEMQAAGALPRAFRGRGCPHCLGSGTRGRVGLFELLVITPGLRRALLEGAGEAEILQVLEAEGGLRSLRQHGLQLAGEGVVSLDEVVRVTRAG